VASNWLIGAVRRSPADLGALEADRAGARRQGAGQHVEDRALARPVRPDQAENLTVLDLERDIVDRGEPAEALVKAGDLQHETAAFPHYCAA